jgi:hypothetical protein
MGSLTPAQHAQALVEIDRARMRWRDAQRFMATKAP